MLTCPNTLCFHPLTPTGVDPNRTPREGDLILCSRCGYVSTIHAYLDITEPCTKYSTQLLTTIEWAKLSQAEMDDLKFAIRVIQAKWRKENPKIIIPWQFRN